MKSFVMDFTRAQKSASIIEKELNESLAQGAFKGASQSESASTGRLIYTLFVNEGQPGKTKAKVFREVSVMDLERKLNEFLKQGAKVIHVLQSSSVKSSNLMVTLFYQDAEVETKKGGSKKDPATDKDPSDETETKTEQGDGTGQNGKDTQNSQPGA